MNLAYSITLAVHSYLRWLVLALALLVLARAASGWRRSAPWAPGDERLHAAFVGTVHLQFTLGLLLYLVLSPISAAFFADPGAAMKVRELRFFGVEHITLMIVAVGVVSGHRARVKKQKESARKHRVAFIGTAVALLLMCAAVPWPFLHVKRPLARGFSAPTRALAQAPTCPPAFDNRCAACHGTSGKADGPLAASLTPRPRSFADQAWQESRTDAQIQAVIQDGGAAAGLSPLMPPHRDLTPEELAQLTACVRSFR